MKIMILKMQKTLKTCWVSKEFKVGFLIISPFILWAIFWSINIYFLRGALNFPYYPKIDIKAELIRPLGSEYFLGTDVYGRSLFEVISMGLVYSLYVSLLVSFFSVTIGIIVGYLAVTGAKFFKMFLEMFSNVVFTFPSILIAIIIMSFMGNSFFGLIAALVCTGWASYARITRGEVKRVLGLPYVESGRALGMTNFQIFFSAVLPNIFPQLLVHLILGMSTVILSESTLGFLGLGGNPYSWGTSLAMGKAVLLEAPYISIIVSIIISILIIGLNLIGDGLRDILDPNIK